MDKVGKNGIFLALPMLFGNALFFLFPFLWVVIISLTFGVNRQWIGLQNYQELLSNPMFKIAVVNSFKFIAISIPLLLILSMLSALLVKRLGRYGLQLMFIMLMPLVMPSSAVTSLLQTIFSNNSVICQIIFKTRLLPESWVDSPSLFGVYICLYIWRNIGFITLMFFISLSSIPKTYYTSAKIDGSTPFRCFLNITLPQLSPAIILTSLISLMRIFDSFRDMLLISGAHPNNAVYMLQHFIYNNFKNMNLARLSSASLLLFIPIFLIILCISPINQRLLFDKGFLDINRALEFERHRLKAPYIAFSIALIAVTLSPFMYYIFKSIGEWNLLFTDKRVYLSRFANSILFSMTILIGNTCMVCAAGFCLAKLRFKGRSLLLFIMTLSALLPIHVTLAPNYIILEKLSLIDSYGALIIPQLFAPRGVFFIMLVFSSIPNGVINAARVDGAGSLNLIRRVALPNSLFGLISVMLLIFIDSWNMVEQPMAFLLSTQKYPLAVYLSVIEDSAKPVLHSLTVLSMLPTTLLLCFCAKLFVNTQKASNHNQ